VSVSAAKWMAGSDLFKRTKEEHRQYLAETIQTTTVDQMAISTKEMIIEPPHN